jgi:hypothetical protein
VRGRARVLRTSAESQREGRDSGVRACPADHNRNGGIIVLRANRQATPAQLYNYLAEWASLDEIIAIVANKLTGMFSTSTLD